MESVAMDHRGTTRNTWVWAALFLQGVVLLITLWSCLRVLSMWSKFGPQALPALLRGFSLSSAEAIASGIALVGLWESKRWGWILAVLANASMCLFTLTNIIQYSAAFLRNPRWLAFSVWDFVALAVLLHRPVRAYFLSQTTPPQQTATRVERREVHWVERGLRVLVYFVTAMAAVCFVTTFSLMLQIGEKAGGAKGLPVILLFGFVLGSGPAFLFTALLALAARIVGLLRLWAWLLMGALLAPGLVLGMGTLASKMSPARDAPGAQIFAFFFTGPLWLFQVWWLTIPAGLIAGFVCFQMFPWAFGERAPE